MVWSKFPHCSVLHVWWSVQLLSLSALHQWPLWVQTSASSLLSYHITSSSTSLWRSLQVCLFFLHWDNQWYFLICGSHSGLPTCPKYFLSSVNRSHTIQKHLSPKSGNHKLSLWQSVICAVAQISILTQFFWYTKYYGKILNYFIILNNNSSGGSAIRTNPYCVFFNKVNMNIWADSDDVTFSQALMLLKLLPFQVQEFQCISSEQFILHNKSTNHIKYWTDIIQYVKNMKLIHLIFKVR